MDAKLNHSDFSALLAKQCNISMAKADNFTKAFFDILVEGLAADGIVKINGLGTFKMIDVASRGSVNVNTGEKIEIKGHRKLTFLPADTLKENVNQPFAMFEPVEVDDDYNDDAEDESATEQSPAVEPLPAEEKTIAEEEPAVEPLPAEEKKPAAAEEPATEPLPAEEKTIAVEEEPATEPTVKKRLVVKSILYTLFIIILCSLALILINRNSKSENIEPAAPIIAEKTVQQPQIKPDTIPVAAVAPQVEPVKEFILVEQMNNLPLAQVTIKDTIIYRPAGTMTIHRIGLDETLTKISLKYFKDKRLWPYIVHYNNIKDYNKLEIGTELQIPHLVPRN